MLRIPAPQRRTTINLPEAVPQTQTPTSDLRSALPDVRPVSRREATLDRDYHGSHDADFASDFDRVRVLTRQAQLEVSSRLGLINYRDGFQYPLTIHFADDAPPGIENALAYVQASQSPFGFRQDLVVNLTELSAHPMDFDTIFYHEMTHAVMNDAVGAEASLKIPHWLQEGMAMYASGEGDDRVKQAAEPLVKSHASDLLYDLDGPVLGSSYPQYYLAVKFMQDKYSVNAVQGVVRDLIQGKTLPDAIQDCMGLSLEQFKKEVQAYSLNIFKDIAQPDGRSGVRRIQDLVPTLNHF
jgi:hypothetical protein